MRWCQALAAQPGSGGCSAAGGSVGATPRAGWPARWPGPQIGLNGPTPTPPALYTENGLYPPPLAGGTSQTSGTLPLNGSWELDFFGRHGRRWPALGGRAGKRRQAARSLLAAEVARAYMPGTGWQRGSTSPADADPARAIARLVQDRVKPGWTRKHELGCRTPAWPTARGSGAEPRWNARRQLRHRLHQAPRRRRHSSPALALAEIAAGHRTMRDGCRQRPGTAVLQPAAEARPGAGCRGNGDSDTRPERLDLGWLPGPTCWASAPTWWPRGRASRPPAQA